MNITKEYNKGMRKYRIERLTRLEPTNDINQRKSLDDNHNGESGQCGFESEKTSHTEERNG